MGHITSQQMAIAGGRMVTLRHGVPEDAAECLRYGRAVLPESDFFSLSPDEFNFTLEYETAWLRENLENEGSVIIVAELEGQLIGMLDFRRSRHRKSAHHGSFGISLRRAYHGQGIGTAMLNMLIGWAKANPLIEMIALDVYSTNTRAIALYKRMGFVECGRKPRCHKLADGRYADDVTMYLSTI